MTSKQEILLQLFKTARVIPVITIDRVDDAVPLARALIAGGVRTLEITLRTAAAVESAKAIIASVPDAVVGMGTVLNAADLDQAALIGARFALSPGATPQLLEAASRHGVPFVPGVATASELMTALAHGFSLCKFFPAQQAGGIPAMRALAGPFPQARFCPTGGIGQSNVAEWLAEPNVIAVGGSWICPSSDVKAGNWDKISQLARRAIDSVAL
jgi:2-dehydro-3-deoxyphosphogluconate aldolase/(4S)-4-hydroxy-2-oxoglutarate aldolase